MRTLRLGLLVISVAVALPARASTALDTGGHWTKLKTAHFTVISQVPEERAHRFAIEMETMRETMRQLTPALRSGTTAVSAPMPTLVFLFADGSTFQAYGGKLNLSGYFQSMPDCNVLAIDTTDADPFRVIRHEYVHDVLEHTFPGLPLWVQEGLADFFGAVRVTPDHVSLGSPIPYHLEQAKGELYPIAGLARVARFKGTDDDGRKRSFYATSWLLVDHLMTVDATTREKFGVYLDRLRAGAAQGQAFTDVFGAELSSFEPELVRISRRSPSEFQRWRVDLPRIETTVDGKPQPMPEDEVLAYTALLLRFADSDDARGRAEHQLQRALGLNPKNAVALVGLGTLRSDPVITTEARDLYRRATEADPDSAVAHYLYANSVGYLTHGQPLDAATAADLRAHLERAVALDPGIGHAKEMLDKLGPPPRPVPTTLAGLEAAFEEDPSRPEIAQPLSKLYQGAQQYAKDRALFERLVAASTKPNIVEWGRANLAIARFNEGIGLLRQKRTREGVALLELAVREAPPSEKDNLAKQLEQIKAQLARKR